jgi:uncharacterized protein YbjT (DUF2867 family)
MILIVGGTGSLGGALARRLLAAGARVRVLTRVEARAAPLAALGAEVVVGDLTDAPSLLRACTGAEAVVTAAHSLFGRGRRSSAHVDGAGHRALAAAAEAAGARRFVHTSAYDYGPAAARIPFFRIKRETEAHLRTRRLALTVLRPTAFMESHAHLLIGAPILAGRTVPLFGRGENPRNFVAADTVAAVAQRVLEDPATIGETIDVAGPHNLTHLEVVRLYERLSGRVARVRHLPLGVLAAAAAVLRPLHPGISQVIRLGILADNGDQRADASALEARFGPGTTLEAFVAARVADASGAAPGTPATAGAVA